MARRLTIWPGADSISTPLAFAQAELGRDFVGKPNGEVFTPPAEDGVGHRFDPGFIEMFLTYPNARGNAGL